MVKLEDFKTCEQSGFCVRHRAFTDYVQKYSNSNLEAGVAAIIFPIKDSVTFGKNSIDLKLSKGNSTSSWNLLHAKIILFSEGIIRVVIQEDQLTGNSQHEKAKARQRVPVLVNEHSDSNFLPYYLSLATYKQIKKEKDLYSIEAENYKLLLDLRSGFSFQVFNKDNALVGIFNNNKWLKIETSEFENVINPSEQSENQNNAPESETEGTTEEDPEISSLKERLNRGKNSENFKGTEDKKPLGPMSIGVDYTFAHSSNVYGLAEHSDGLELKTTRGENKVYQDPYRLYNLDVFEYELNTNTALYGSVPLIVAHSSIEGKSKSWTSAFFWLNAAETWVDIEKRSANTEFVVQNQERTSFNDEETVTHWISESGLFDSFILVGDNNPKTVFRQYSMLTGSSVLPQAFSLGYHQCRWNYNDEDDINNLVEKFEQYEIPVDVFWLDIEHTNEKRYFTWDYKKFKNPRKMQERVASLGRKMVTIIDPHIKIDSNYQVYSKAKDLNLFTKNKNGDDFNGWCWSGDSAYLDFLNPSARKFWMESFLTYSDATEHLFTWNDMNEPSVFNGPETTMPKDNIHFGGVEHRDIHNIYGLLHHRSSYSGHIYRSISSTTLLNSPEVNSFTARSSLLSGPKPHRPFILTRAFFSGTQRYGAIWIGDNMAKWEHLEKTIPILLSISLSGINFCGSDVGGFFFDPSNELLVRWYQSGLYYPFFRAHSHIDTKRREPWLLGSENLEFIKTAISTRYRLLLVYYTLFRESQITGLLPIIRPLWMSFPSERHIFSVEDEFMLGDLMLIKPIVHELSKKSDIEVLLPGDKALWYNFYSLTAYESGTHKFTNLKLSSVAPAFIREGVVIPLKERMRRSSLLMLKDPITLVCALNAVGRADGNVYVDDGESFEYIFKGKFIHKEFRISVTDEIVIEIKDKKSIAENNDIWRKPFLTEEANRSYYDKMSFVSSNPTEDSDEFSQTKIEEVVLVDGYGRLENLRRKSNLKILINNEVQPDLIISMEKAEEKAYFGDSHGHKKSYIYRIKGLGFLLCKGGKINIK